MRMVEVRGRYANLTGILTYTGESRTVIEDPERTPEETAALQEANDLKAAQEATEYFFFRRQGEMIDYTVKDVVPVNYGLPSTDGFDDLVEDEPDDLDE